MKRLSGLLIESLRDLAPIFVVIAFFQFIILRQPIQDFAELVPGIIMVVVGLTLFVQGLEMGLFPIGENLAYAFAKKGSVAWTVAFAFALGFGTTVAEPALIAVSQEAAEVAALEGIIGTDSESTGRYALEIRLTVAAAVGTAIVIGVIRIIKGWPIQYWILGGYACVIALTYFAPPEIVGIAYDAGGVTTSTITVPLVTAVGVGLASSIRGRNPLTDGFGLIAFASLTPMCFVLVYGMIV